jgi:hypothetical protein
VLTLLAWRLRVGALTRPFICSQFRSVFRAAEDRVASLEFKPQFYRERSRTGSECIYPSHWRTSLHGNRNVGASSRNGLESLGDPFKAAVRKVSVLPWMTTRQYLLGFGPVPSPTHRSNCAGWQVGLGRTAQFRFHSVLQAIGDDQQ